MPHQRMRRPGGDSDDSTVLELSRVDIPDVSGQLERLSAAAAEAGVEKQNTRQKQRQEMREREERARCCGIRI